MKKQQKKQLSCSMLLKAGGVIKGRGIIEGLPQTPALMCQNSMFYRTSPKKIHQNHVIEDRLQTHVIEDRLQTHVIEDRLQTHAQSGGIRRSVSFRTSSMNSFSSGLPSSCIYMSSSSSSSSSSFLKVCKLLSKFFYFKI